MNKLKIIGIVIFCTIFLGNAQNIDQTILYSRMENEGSARYIAMGGVTGGVLGSELAGISNFNPAAVVLFDNINSIKTMDTQFSLESTIGPRFTVTKARFTDEGFNSRNSMVGGEIGGHLVFKNSQNYTLFPRFAISSNLQNINNFSKEFSIPSSKNFHTIIIREYEQGGVKKTDTLFFDKLSFFSKGSISKNSLNFGGIYTDLISFGAGLHAYQLNHNKFDELFETVINTKEQVKFSINDFLATGRGFGLSVGVILKPIEKVNIGMAYHSPIWYSIKQDFKQAKIFNKYKLNLPSKLVLSGGINVIKNLVLGLGYEFINYSSIKFRKLNNISSVNNWIGQNLKNTNKYRIGAEYVWDMLSFRGGFIFEELPTSALSDREFINQKIYDYLTSRAKKGRKIYSFGIGYKFMNKYNLDLSFSKSVENRDYIIYPTNQVPFSEVEFNNIAIMLTFKWTFKSNGLLFIL